jgi:hypothetical protein
MNFWIGYALGFLTPIILVALYMWLVIPPSGGAAGIEEDFE